MIEIEVSGNDLAVEIRNGMDKASFGIEAGLPETLTIIKCRGLKLKRSDVGSLVFEIDTGTAERKRG